MIALSYILIKAIDASEPLIRMPKIIAVKAGIGHRKRIRISYGIKQDEVLVAIADDIPKDIIELDHVTIEYLRIDTSLRYDYQLHQERFIIGPVIGLLFGYNGEKLKNRLIKRQDIYLPYARINAKIGGLIYIFASDQINYEQEEINGYIFQNESSSWEKRVFPFPAVIYRRCSVSRRLVQIMRGRILNSYKFDKYQFWQMLKEHPELSANLPETTAIIDKHNLDLLLGKFGKVYLKHTKKSLGRSIYLISKKDNKYIIRKNYQERIRSLSKREIKIFLSKRNNNYILQQAIDLKAHETRKIDYRVIVAKDLNDHWKCLGIIGWLGDLNGITIHTMVEVNGKKAEEMLRLQFNYNSNKKIKDKVNELVETGILLASELDYQAGPYIDFGFDIGLDVNEKLWIFEANVCQELKSPLWINDYAMYEEIIKCVIAYVRKIAMN